MCDLIQSIGTVVIFVYFRCIKGKEVFKRQLEYLLIELLQVDYSMPVMLKGEMILHMHDRWHECLYSFQHFEVCKKTIHQHGEVEDLISIEAINHDSF